MAGPSAITGKIAKVTPKKPAPKKPAPKKPAPKATAPKATAPKGTGSKTPPPKTPTVPTVPVVDTSAMDATNERIAQLEAELAKSQLRSEQEAALSAAEKQEKRQSIYDTVTSELTRLGLSSLINPLKKIFESGVSDGDSLRLALSQTPEYETRFSANAKRIAAGLSALSPAEYIQLEDQYQNVMRNYGLPASYYAKDLTGKQIGFDELLAGDVSSTELEERLITAQDRVLKSSPEILKALKDFYPDIKNGDILAYTLDPKNALKDIQRKVVAAEIQGAATAQGLNKITPDMTPEQVASFKARADFLAASGVDKAAAQEGFQTVAEVAPRGSMLSEIYKQGPYGQTQAEQEVFNLAGSAEAARQRKKLTSLETAAFSGSAGVGALARERAGNI